MRIVGDLDAAGAPRVRAELQEALSRADPVHVVIDLTEVPFCDSVGLGVLVTAHNHVRNRHGRLILVVAPGMISHLLTITNLDRHFEISRSMGDARAALGVAA